MVGSLGIGPSSPTASWRFVEDQRLLAVFLTRARHQFHLITSADPPPGTVLSDFLAAADRPPGPPPPSTPRAGWTTDLAETLVSAGVPTHPGYRTGRHTVDLCLGTPTKCFALVTGVHPAGPRAHVERQLALRQAGWTLRDAFPSRWSERRGELVVGLRSDLAPPPG